MNSFISKLSFEFRQFLYNFSKRNYLKIPAQHLKFIIKYLQHVFGTKYQHWPNNYYSASPVLLWMLQSSVWKTAMPNQQLLTENSSQCIKESYLPRFKVKLIK